ncbi:MAG: peptide-methionine (S)-S-oxide reductase MsrA [Gammaproteobacteria bacterium]|nr:peptide-methionine (S)-S-oxide reductase MsrA [Gammaproteobacteria bacterium]
MKTFILTTVVLIAGLLALQYYSTTVDATQYPKAKVEEKDLTGLSVATFAGGCFWCVESGFEKLPGVVEVISGYTGGTTENPTYEAVSSGTTGHTEAVQVYYDPKRIGYQTLVAALWRQIDPTDGKGQFSDRGLQYRPGIYYHDDTEREIAEQSAKELEESGHYQKPLAVEIVPFKAFYRAEEYHQDYYRKNPLRYRYYRSGSGRDRYLEKIWGDELHAKLPGVEQPAADNTTNPDQYLKPSAEEIKSRLTSLQYEVTQQEGTEPPFDNEYWDEKRQGIYVDIVTGEPLFSSRDKYRSGTGWPSFTKPISDSYIVQRTDYQLIYPRQEIRSKIGDSHLGHVFEDGPEPTGLRYCLNSAALRFVPREEMAAQGYGGLLSELE